MPKLYFTNNNKTEKDKLNNFKISKYIKAIIGNDYKHYSFDDFTKETNKNDELYLIVDNLTDDEYSKIIKFINNLGECHILKNFK